ncbi:MAG TPA: asparagine synthase (glutamine-hydrolyzing) [Phycisphaerae bacterium]|nr:asparagine synthase (glutamine-hydrolyzing) [Phycisphaerae bacterium]HRY66803.1 asparagine synthase (glutamine-hydrolyzing) [Phycisphaerae bacterium]HSA26861.1 asparagine synthase (glutamine-hydrolyzing) [Phycisphaerae bacterium]
MCGICGIVDYSDRPISGELVDRMRDMMLPRGPDDAGTVVLPHAGLGHRRLSIIDLSPRGHQPMANEDQTVWMVFNGEIYNFQELRPELESAGHRFVSDTDSEVLIHGYEQWGIEGLLTRINGMFGLALWDGRREELHLARDRLGKKPVYYGWHEGRFLFGSDVKSIWSVAPSGWQPRMEAIARYLYWRFVPGREAAFKDVYQLLPAHYLTLTRAGWAERRYWRLSFADKVRASFSDIMERTSELVSSAVRRRLVSDVPLGAFLSGGVDSSYIVSLMAEASPGRVRTFAIGTEDPDHDERAFARLVAGRWNTDHTEFQVSPDAWLLLPRLVWSFGQPFGDAAAIPTYYVAHCARQHVTVALTGDGGDESFAGYSQHHGYHLAHLVGWCLPDALLNRVFSRVKGYMYSESRAPAAMAARFLRYAHSDPLVAWGGVSSWALHHLGRIWAGAAGPLATRENLLAYTEEVMKGYDGDNALDRALFDDLHVLLPFCYNVKVDVATMMSSLEARSPFQDQLVVEWAARLKPGIKLRPWEKKYLLKRLAARRVPKEVVFRRKHGFSIPIDGWFEGAWARRAHEIILGKTARSRGLFDYGYVARLWEEHQSHVACHGTRFWLLLWLELWFRMFVDRTMGPDDSLDSLV